MTDRADAVQFSLVLRPHRSASSRTLLKICLFVFVALFAVGLAFVANGAWPVAPFMGLEVLLLYGAFRLNQRAGNAYEAINLTVSALTVRRVDPWGKHSDFSFQPQWLQVNLAEPAGPQTHLELRSQGRSLIIGRFLLPEERSWIAQVLRRELHRVTAARAL